jgi:hypothetical protein
MALFSLAHCLASRTLIRAGHVARMTKNPAPKRLMLPWVGKPWIAGGQEMTYGRSLGRHLEHVGLAHADGAALAFTEWATLAQDRAGWRMRVAKPPSISANRMCGSPGVTPGCHRRTSGASSRNAPPKPSSATPSSTPRPSCNNNIS